MQKNGIKFVKKNINKINKQLSIEKKWNDFFKNRKF